MTIRAVVHDASAAQPVPYSVALRRVERVADLTRNDVVVVREAQSDEPITIDLQPGFWALDVQSPGLWHAQKIITIAGASAEIAAHLFPSGTIAGTLAATTSQRVTALRIRFQPSADSGAEPGDADCIVSSARFQCTIPAGLHDIRLRAPGLAPFYRNGVKLKAGAETNVGVVRLQPGASIVGRVAVPRGTRIDLTGARVTVRPANSTAIGAASSLLPMETTVTDKGSFHLDGIPPGQYEVVAVGPNRLASKSSQVVVYAGAEIEITDPLTLETPKSLQVTIVPPLDPSGRRWKVEISSDHGTMRNHVEGSLAAQNGTWRSPLLRSGRYVLTIGTRDGDDNWHEEEIDLHSSTSDVLVSMNIRHVHGRVLLGDKPLEAHLTFLSASARVELTSDATGAFSGVLPIAKNDEWSVTVESRSPEVKRYLTRQTPRAKPEGDAEIELVLPASEIVGVVVDADGRHVFPAMVNIRRQGEHLIQVPVEKNGEFAVHGLEGDAYEVQATAFLEQSDTVRVDLKPDDVSEPLQLVLRQSRKIVGRVFSDFGPVAGADVRIWSADVAAVRGDHDVSNAAGEFWVAVPAATREIDVQVEPPGFALKLLRTHIGEGGLNIRVDQRGGSLTARGHQEGFLRMLIHGGGYSSVEAIAPFWRSRVEREEVTLDSMEPGPYLLCSVRESEIPALIAGRIDQNARCSAGFLPPFGTLTLDAKKAE